MTRTFSSLKKTLTSISGIVAIGLLSACGGSDSTQTGDEVTWTLATMAPQNSDQQAVEDAYLDMLEENSEGRINIRRTEPLSLCAADEIADCVQDGRAEIGSGVPDYTPHYFPTAALASIPFIGEDWQAIMQTQHDLHQENEDVMQSLANYGIYHAGTYPVGRLFIGTRERLDGPEDLENMSIRGSGPLTIQMLEMSGANLVSLPSDEAYEAIDRGVVDSVAGSLTFPSMQSLDEVLPYWVDAGVGEYSNYGLWINQDAYDALPEDLQAVVDEATERLVDGVAVAAFHEAQNGMCEAIQERGNIEEMDSWDEQTVDEWGGDMMESLYDSWLASADEYGLSDAEAVLDQYLEGLDQHAEGDYEDAGMACVDSF